MTIPTIENPDKPWESFEKKEELGWGEALVRGAEALPSSTVGVASDVYEAVTNPIDTGDMILNLMSGGLQHILPEGITEGILDSENKEIASQVGEYYSNKYGSEEEIKKAIATDPASILADLATIMTAGGGAVAKLGQVSKLEKVADIGKKVSKASSYVDPLSLAAKGVGTAGYVAGQAAKHVAGQTTGVGVAPLEAAYRAGKSGGEIQKQFIDNLKGKVPLSQALDTAKQNLEILKQNKLEAYKSNEKLWKADTQQLSFDDIDNALSGAEKLVRFKGRVKNQKGSEVLNDISKEISAWKKLDPKEFHTPEGLDALKQSLWAIRENIPMENRQAQAVATAAYNSVKNTIAKQAPAYSRAMKEYGDASETINEITRTLSLGDKAMPDTAMRKLQSIMRDDVSTNYGHRGQLAGELADAGKDFRPALAGQSLQSLAPRGIVRGTSLPTAGMAGYFGGPAVAAGTLASQSPRVMGTASNIAGQVAGKAKQFRDTIPVSNQGIQGLLNYMYQTQQFQGDK